MHAVRAGVNINNSDTVHTVGQLTLSAWINLYDKLGELKWYKGFRFIGAVY